MPRVSVNLPDHDFKWLSETAVVLRRSRASLMREAVSFFRGVPKAEADLAWIEQGVGAWKDRAEVIDAVGCDRRERASATRPWDYDYEIIKAEFPDLFDDEDDRHRRIFLEMIARKASEQRDNKASIT